MWNQPAVDMLIDLAIPIAVVCSLFAVRFFISRRHRSTPVEIVSRLTEAEVAERLRNQSRAFNKQLDALWEQIGRYEEARSQDIERLQKRVDRLERAVQQLAAAGPPEGRPPP